MIKERRNAEYVHQSWAEFGHWVDAETGKPLSEFERLMRALHKLSLEIMYIQAFLGVKNTKP